jgi:MFS family permease
MLKGQLGFTSTQVGTLNAIYSFPNIIMVLIGGVIVDRIGTRTATLVFTAICMLGAILTGLARSFPAMAAGRLVFGLGAESMIVAVTAALGQWFKGKQLAFAFGLNISIARAGSYAADLSPSWAKAAYAAGWQQPMLIAIGFGFISLVAAAVYFLLERGAAPRYTLGVPPPPDRVVWSDLWRFDRSYWYVVGLCVTFYSVIFPFRSTFAIEYFQNAHGLSLERAGQMNGYVFLAAIFATPLFGYAVDRLGYRSFFMAVGSLLLVLVFPTLIYTRWSLWVSTALIGIAFSLVPAVLWPSVPYLVEERRLGTAYGLMTMLQNIGLWAGPARRIRAATSPCSGCSPSSAWLDSSSRCCCGGARPAPTATAWRRCARGWDRARPAPESAQGSAASQRSAGSTHCTPLFREVLFAVPLRRTSWTAVGTPSFPWKCRREGDSSSSAHLHSIRQAGRRLSARTKSTSRFSLSRM